MATSKRPTIFDVARQAGVSTGTVSRVILNSERVAPQTRAKVKDAMSNLGYQPNAAAQAMRLQVTKTVGLFIPDVTSAHYTVVARAAEEVLTNAGYLLVISSSARSGEGELKLLANFKKRRMDGLIMALSDETNETVLEELEGLDAPMVIIDRDTRIHADQVLTEHAGVMRQTVAHLVELGHRRIGLIAPSDKIRPGRERLRGYREGLEQANVPFDPELVVCEDQSLDYGFREAYRILMLEQPPTALIAAGNDILYGTLRALKLLDVNVPKDLSLVAADDRLVSDYTSPPITVIQRDMRAVGRLAAEMLLSRLLYDSEAPPKAITLPSDIIYRPSIARVKPS